MKLSQVIAKVAAAYIGAQDQTAWSGNEDELRSEFCGCETLEALVELLEYLGFSSQLEASTFILQVIIEED